MKGGKHQKPTATERKMRIVKLPAERRKTCWSPTSAAGPPVVLLLLLMALLLLLTRPVCVDDVNNNIIIIRSITKFVIFKSKSISI
jgi:hypothetical protein